MSHIEIEGHSGYVKDTNTGAILNINKTEIQNARMRKTKRKQEEIEIQNMKHSVENLQSEVSEIKTLLNKIIEKL